jgi:hypothetical protein
MGIKVTFLRDEDDKGAAVTQQAVTLVPKAAILTESGQSAAFVVKSDGTVERHAVRVGGTDGDRVEVLAGLHENDRVVLSPTAALKDGAKVVVK